MAHLKFNGALLLLLFLCALFTGAEGQAINYDQREPDLLVDAMQVIWGEWNRSTPNLGSNLAGWSSTQIYPCKVDISTDNARPHWRGVQCISVNCSETCDGYIIGMHLDRDSIEGILPPEIGSISQLSSLRLTGNPKLTGPLPQEIQMTNLRELDLHDNAFNGTLPYLLKLFTLLNVDLSGNRFVGEIFPQIRNWNDLQTLKLARNQFSGSIPTDAFVSKTQLVELDLSSNNLIGPLPNLTTFLDLQSLVLSNNGFNGSLPDLRMFPNLYFLKLAYNNLSGNFPLSSFVDTNDNIGLLILDLSGNQLTGSVTGWNGSDLASEFLGELYLDNTGISGTLDITRLIENGLVQNKFGISSGYGNLTIMSLMNNDINDVVYTAGSIEDIATVIRLQGNPYCQKEADDGTRCFCEQYCKNRGSPSNKKVILIASLSSTISLFFVLVVVVAVLYRAQRYKRYLLLQFQQKFEEFDVKPTIFPFHELRAATRDFHPDMKLGEGGYGAVYKGVFPNRSVVAVKQLFVKSTQGIDDFLNEVVLITGMKHKNLVNLKGCCLCEHQRLLVYEYVDNYDVNQVLLRGERRTPLGWVARLNICLGVARGLDYLHSLAHPRIIHRDIKASNILLDKNFKPKIADFGLALLFPDEESHIVTRHVAGTTGYLAPEYASLGQLSEKVDVFSFGILCLEVLSGRQNIDKTRPLDEVYLSNWAWKLHGEGRLMELVDPSLSLQDDERLAMQRLINVSLLCSQHEAEQRPTMARVVAMLQHDTQLEVVVLNSSSQSGGTSIPHEEVDTMRLLAFGGCDLTISGELTTVVEEEDDESSLRSSNARSARSGAGGELSTQGILELSDMRGK